MSDNNNRGVQLLAAFAGAGVAGNILGYNADFLNDPMMSAYLCGLFTGGAAVAPAAVSRLIQEFPENRKEVETTNKLEAPDPW